jgi:hypothetical protein
MRLACPAVAERNDVLAAQDIFAPCELDHHHLVQAGNGGELEGVEALHRRETGCADPPLDGPALAVDELQLDKPQQVARVVDPALRAFTRDLFVLAQNGRQFELFEMMGEQHLWRTCGRAHRHGVLVRHAASTA